MKNRRYLDGPVEPLAARPQIESAGDGIVRIRLGRPHGAPFISAQIGGPGSMPDIGLEFGRVGEFPLFMAPLAPDEKLFGLGQHNERTLDLRGHRYRLYNRYRSHMLAVPVLISSRGYALVMDTTWPTEIDLSGDRIRWLSEEGALSFFVIRKKTPKELLGAVADLTGHAPLPPRWAFGWQQSRWGYETEAQTRDVVRTFVEKKTPCDAVVLDLDWFGGHARMGDLQFDRRSWPNPEGMVRDFLREGVRIVLINEPFIRPGTAWLQEMIRRGFLARRSNGRPAMFEGPWFVPQYLFDFTNPSAGGWWWEKLRPLFELGVAGWWCDLGEPQDHPGGLAHHGGSTDQVRNVFTYRWNQAIYEGQRKTSNFRVYQLSRSGCAGLQKFGAGVWTHDVRGDFKTLAWHFHVGQNVGLSGLPYWGLDVGGFCRHKKLNPDWYVRSFQFGAFCPNFRGHSDHEAREPWAFGPEVERICRAFADLRMRLMPYISALAWDAHERGLPYIRPVFLEMPEDPVAWNLPDEFMFGPSLLIVPVAAGRDAVRTVRLPSGRWWDFWTSRRIDGPATFEVSVPLDRIPIYVRDGSILPLAPPMRHVFETPWNPLTLRVYGAGRFTLIEDDGLTYDYEKGAVTRTTIESKRVGDKILVDVGKPEGPFPIPEDRRWIIETHMS